MRSQTPNASPPRHPPAREVAIALVWRGAQLLIALRPSAALEGGKWEFPGGKLEPGESAEEALVRECREELGVRVVPLGLAWTSHVVRPPPQGALLLHFFHAALAPGEAPQALAADQLAWSGIDELSTRPFCSADAELLQALHERRIAPPAGV